MFFLLSSYCQILIRIYIHIYIYIYIYIYRERERERVQDITPRKVLRDSQKNPKKTNLRTLSIDTQNWEQITDDSKLIKM